MKKRARFICLQPKLEDAITLLVAILQLIFSIYHLVIMLGDTLWFKSF
jgi:hypothetical protein